MEIGLIVEEVGLVLSVGFHRAKEIFRSLVAQSIGPRKIFASQSHISAGTEQGHRC